MKMFEVEQKYRLKSPVPIRRALKRIGAKKVASGSEINEFFDRQGSLKRRKVAMRLRRFGGRATLTLKGPRLRSRYTRRMELETPVDHDLFRSILLRSGFRAVMKYAKYRELYRMKGVCVTIDRVKGFGWFLEIEGTVKMIAKIEAALGLTHTGREKRSYLQMLFGYRH